MLFQNVQQIYDFFSVFFYYWPITQSILQLKYYDEFPPTFWANHCPYYNYRSVAAFQKNDQNII